MKKIFIIVITLMTTLIGCSVKDKPTTNLHVITFKGINDVYDNQVPLMNTTITLNLYGVEKYDDIEREINDLLVNYHQLFDSYHYYRDAGGAVINNIATINDSYGSGTALVVDEVLIDALEEAFFMMELSEGYFNPFLGTLTDLWKPYFSAFPVENTGPTSDEVEQALACTVTTENWEDVIYINRNNNTIKFNKLDGCNSKVSLNLGAFVKGYVLEEAKKLLSSYEVSYLFNMGQSSIYGHDYGDFGRKWKIGAISPYGQEEAYIIQLDSQEALSTSGDYYQLFIYNKEDGTQGIRSHLLNPFTGYSENDYRMVSVVSNNNLVSEVLTTVLFVVTDSQQQDKIIKSFKQEYNTNIDVLWYQEDYYNSDNVTLVVTKHFSDMLLKDTLESRIKEVKLWEK